MDVSKSVTNSVLKPRTMAELLPGLSGLISEDALKSLTAKKQPRATVVVSQTTEKVRPLTMAQITAKIQVLSGQSSKKPALSSTSTIKRKNWNSSVKVEQKRIFHTANGELARNSVRKVLNFQPKPPTSNLKTQNIGNARMTTHTETPKFPKPEFRAKKSIHMQAKTNLRISGVYKMSETPVETKKVLTNRKTMANKENISSQLHLARKTVVPSQLTRKLLAANRVPDTPLLNDTSKSSCDASFLLKEKEIQDDDKLEVLKQKETLDNITEVTPPVSTPFKEYRNVEEYFNNTSEMDNSVGCNDNTIMCFEKPSLCKENASREESVIVSLCDLLNKAKVTNADKKSNELDDLLEVEKQTVHNIKMIENGVEILINIKKSQIKSLHQVRKLIKEKKLGFKQNEEVYENVLGQDKIPKVNIMEGNNKNDSPITGKPCSVIKSPSYKVPKKNSCLRKQVFHKSMPSKLNIQSPTKVVDNRALHMYMKMKEQMNFLSTPVHKPIRRVVDTPTVTSNNLQKQLDNLYNGS